MLGAIALAPLLLASLRRRPTLLCIVAAALIPLPLAIPLPYTIVRFGALIVTLLIVMKAIQIRTGDETPRSWLDALQFFTVLVRADWDAPRTPSLRRAGRRLAIGLGQMALLGAIVVAAGAVHPAGVAQIVVKEIALYLALSSTANAAAFHLDLRGVPYRPPFDWPLLSRTLSEFWSCRWNTWMSHILYRYAFIPAGGARHPLRGTIAAFGLSGLLHEVLVVLAAWRSPGWMLMFFLTQGLLVIAGARAGFTRFARRRPAIARAITLAVLLVTGALFIRGIDPVIEP